MTRPKLGRSPVSSFGPELMELLIQGSQKRLEIPCDSMAQMKFLQMRIHALRGAMNKENHPNYQMATKARTSCTWDHTKFPGRFPKDATNCVLVVAPNDSQFAGILERAGITPSAAAQDVLDTLPLPETPSDPSIQSAPEESNSNPYGKFT